MNAPTEHEARRQQLLLRALWRDEPGDALRGWLREAHDGANDRGLAAYRGNAGALAERALASAFPTVASLVGDESFGALARDFWRHHPPARGDLGEWGAALPEFISANAELASEPYLPDSARLDWLVHLASRAADGPDQAPALAALGQHPPEGLQLALRPGCAVLTSRWPVATIWSAHQQQGEARFDAVRAAFASGAGEQALVHRDGHAVRVEALDADAARFTTAVIAGVSLAGALDDAGDGFVFEHWLVHALQQRWLVGVRILQSPSTGPSP
jgi:Putative DNA-binding domain